MIRPALARASAMLLIPDLVGPLAERDVRSPSDQRLDDRPARRPLRGVGMGPHRRAGLAARTCSAISPTPASALGTITPAVAAADGPDRRRPS